MSNKAIWILMLVLLVVILMVIGLGAGFYYLLNKPVTVQRDTVVEIAVTGQISEFPSQDPLGSLFASVGSNLWDLSQIFRSAANDERVSAIYMEIHPFSASWAQVEEIRDDIKQFQESGKKVHSFLSVDIATEIQLYLASASDSITMNPTSGFLIDGLMSEVVFMKRTLDKIGVKPQFLQFKEYKSAETYTRQNLSPEIREMLESVLGEIQNRFIETVAEERNLEPGKLAELVDIGILTSDLALEAGLIDRQAYRNEIRSTLNDKQGKYNGIPMSTYLDASSYRKTGSPKARVAVVGGFGTIITGKSNDFSGIMGGSTLSQRLRELRENDSIDGVIFRVNSPGGSAVGSDMIWREVRELEASGKPVIVSMSGVAGSGGYYISMGARRIICQPSTITGSIGVIFGKFDLSGLYDWLGMDIDRVKLAKNADLFSLYSSLSEEQREQITNWMEDVYDAFVTKAAEGRNMTYEALEPKAHGRIYTGSQAKEEGLVDELGGMAVAISEMKSALSLKEDDLISLQIYPRPKTLLETLTSGDLFELRQKFSMIDWLRSELQQMEVPSVWLLAPEITIK